MHQAESDSARNANGGNGPLVYFASSGRERRGGTCAALEQLFRRAAIADAIDDGEVVAIKVHFGELGNTRYLRPTLVKRLVELVDAAGGRPFVTDTTTLYRHHRHDLFGHLENARLNGFTPETLGCPVIIADGIKSNGVQVAVESNQTIAAVSVAQAIHDADVLLNAAHLTFHHEFTWAGAVKALGMGCTTKQMKLLMHTPTGKPIFHQEKCTNCRLCLKYCPGEALETQSGRIVFDPGKCLGCGDCFAFCAGEAIYLPWGEAGPELVRRTAECAQGVLAAFRPRKAWHILFALDITDNCDCIGESGGPPALPDLGVLVSEDPVAVDLAALEVAEQTNLLGSRKEAAQRFRATMARTVLPSRAYTIQTI